jgi:hypothetical protein
MLKILNIILLWLLIFYLNRQVAKQNGELKYPERCKFKRKRKAYTSILTIFLLMHRKKIVRTILMLIQTALEYNVHFGGISHSYITF